jgi:hypothetical protein
MDDQGFVPLQKLHRSHPDLTRHLSIGGGVGPLLNHHTHCHAYCHCHLSHHGSGNHGHGSGSGNYHSSGSGQFLGESLHVPLFEDFLNRQNYRGRTRHRRSRCLVIPGALGKNMG